LRAVTVTDSSRLAVTDVADPELQLGGAVVRVKACGICGSDLHMLEAGIVPAGAIMGHEASGVVEAVASDVEGLRPGDHVAVHPFDPCGSCAACLAGASQRCVNTATTTIGLGFRAGAYAELLEVSAQMLVRMPGDVPVEYCALAEPLSVALHGFRRSRFEPGSKVGVIGCGPIGLCAVLAARTLGAGRIWACDMNEYRASLAAAVGADETGATPREADIVIECAGARGTVDLAVAAARSGGQVVLLAVNIKGDSVWPFVWVTKEVDIVPCLGYNLAEYREAADWIATERVDVAPLITKRVPLEGTDAAFADLLNGAPEGKVLVTP
jgi:(R,R)-butanediol dehydrogenase/meso-butanediol dehydrogenase/diacetyl reductase